MREAIFAILLSLSITYALYRVWEQTKEEIAERVVAKQMEQPKGEGGSYRHVCIDGRMFIESDHGLAQLFSMGVHGAQIQTCEN